MFATKTAEEFGPAIDMTPMIDMVFLLLTFFLAATTYHQAEREMKIALPEASSSVPISAALRDIVVNVDVEGRIIVGGLQMEPAAFQDLVTRSVAGNAQQKVTVRGDRATSYANVVRVLDICKGAGVAEPYLDTIPAK